MNYIIIMIFTQKKKPQRLIKENRENN
jgi:hypothetical protein